MNINQQNLPKVYFSYESLYNDILKQSMFIDKITRIIHIERNILNNLTINLKYIIELSYFKNKMNEKEIDNIFKNIIINNTLILSCISTIYFLKKINEKYYFKLISNLENIQKQISGWKNFLLSSKIQK